MKNLFLIALISIIFSISAVKAVAQTRSVYTSLSTKVCRELKSNADEGTEYQGDCPGIAGYKLRFLEGDLRQSIDVITPAKKKFQLGFWNISGAFSHLGDKAEWRMKGRIPIALIVRFNSQEDPENPKTVKSSLVVAKISAAESCITDVVVPMSNQNAIARKLAEEAPTRACMYPKQ